MSQELNKQKAALRAVEAVQDGMKIGLGTGSTAKYFIDAVGEKIAGGMKLSCVPTSQATRQQAESLNIPLIDLDTAGRLDLTVDGADEMDGDLTLIKGGGGALLREKIVASASDAMIVIGDESKLVKQLGAFPLPVEVNPFAHETTTRTMRNVLKDTGHAGDIILRVTNDNAKPFITDNGHYIYDCHLGIINNAPALSQALLNIAGVVEHGLFIDLATGAIIASPDGLIEKGKI